MKQKAQYSTCCVDARGDDIEAMRDDAREITLSTFRKRADCREWEESAGYGRHFPLARDYHVRFFKSRYLGRPCYYVVHSAIEYIFLQPLGFSPLR